MNFQSILVQMPGGTSNSMVWNIVLWVGIFVVFYFFMIRPQQKKQKDQKNFIENLKKGDGVVTIGGLHGKVYAVEGNTVIVEVDKGLKLTFEKTAISREATVKLPA